VVNITVPVNRMATTSPDLSVGTVAIATPPQYSACRRTRFPEQVPRPPGAYQSPCAGSTLVPPASRPGSAPRTPRVHSLQIVPFQGKTKMHLHGTRSGFLKNPKKFLTRNSGLRADRPQSCPFDPRMVGKRQGSSRPIGTLANHCDVLAFSHHPESQQLQRSDHARFGGIRRELSAHKTTPASATKASITGESESSASAPKVST
jgi:hypothetical protein